MDPNSATPETNPDSDGKRKLKNPESSGYRRLVAVSLGISAIALIAFGFMAASHINRISILESQILRLENTLRSNVARAESAIELHEAARESLSHSQSELAGKQVEYVADLARGSAARESSTRQVRNEINYLEGVLRDIEFDIDSSL
jgi:hypothetical protein